MSEARFQKLQEELLEALAKLKEIHECPGMTLEILRTIVLGWKNVAGVPSKPSPVAPAAKPEEPEFLDGVDCKRLRESMLKYVASQDLETVTPRKVFAALEEELQLEPKKLTSSPQLTEYCKRLLDEVLAADDGQQPEPVDQAKLGQALEKYLEGKDLGQLTLGSLLTTMEETLKLEPKAISGNRKLKQFCKDIVGSFQSNKKRKPAAQADSSSKRAKPETLSVARRKAIEIFVEAFSVDPRPTPQDLDKTVLATQLEEAITEKFGSDAPWATKVRALKFNLSDIQNPLRYLVIRELIEMKPDELASDEKREEMKKLYEKAKFDTLAPKPPEQTSDRFKCSNCGQRRTTYYQLQTRSADEPMTVFVTCVNCGRRWKFS